MSNFILGLLFYWLPVLDFVLVSWSPASFADFANTRPFSTLNHLGESKGSLLISAEHKRNSSEILAGRRSILGLFSRITVLEFIEGREDRLARN